MENGNTNRDPPARIIYRVDFVLSDSNIALNLESQVKEIKHRTKGAEKFWNDNQDAEAILQVRAAIIGDDERLAKHFQKRVGYPYDRKTTKQKH